MSQEFRMELSPPIKKSSQEIKGDESQEPSTQSIEGAPKRSQCVDAAPSPRPWAWLPDEGQFIVDARGNVVGEIPCQGCNPADGELIVAAVNAYVPHRFAAMDALVDAAKEALNFIAITQTGMDMNPARYVAFGMMKDQLRAALAAVENNSTQIDGASPRPLVDGKP